jgi:hypothetical protein
MSPRLRRVLHRAFDLIADSGNAERQTREYALCSARRSQSLQDFWRSSTTVRVFEFAWERGNVRNQRRRYSNARACDTFLVLARTFDRQPAWRWRVSRCALRNHDAPARSNATKLQELRNQRAAFRIGLKRATRALKTKLSIRFELRFVEPLIGRSLLRELAVSLSKFE